MVVAAPAADPAGELLDAEDELELDEHAAHIAATSSATAANEPRLMAAKHMPPLSIGREPEPWVAAAPHTTPDASRPGFSPTADESANSMASR